MMDDGASFPTGGADVASSLLDEYLRLKDELGPLERRLAVVRDRLRDFVTERGHFLDEIRGVFVTVEPRFRTEYDAERLLIEFPRLSGCVKRTVDAAQLEACLGAGMVTETDLEQHGVLFKVLHSRALVIKNVGYLTK